MANEYVVDAHALVWYLEGNQRLGSNARAALDDPTSGLYLPIIALAEACWVVERRQTTIPSVTDLLTEIDADPRIVVLPLDRAILDRSLSLTALSEMHDRQIVATALNLSTSTAILTADREITACGLVAVVW